MDYRGLLRRAEDELRAAGIDDWKHDAWALMEHALGIDRLGYLLDGGSTVAADGENEYKRLVGLRCSHVPLQHITGSAWFYGREFAVTPDVLIPRQDTEVLVGEALSRLEGGSVLDLCTGSGCIVLSLLLEKSGLNGVGTDISGAALEVARRNGERLGVDCNASGEACTVDFRQGDLYGALGEGETFDMVVSNPPYIPTGDIEGLDPEVRLHDPMLALDGHEDGLYFYRRIIDGCEGHLKRGGWLVLEIGMDQGAAVASMMEQKGFGDVLVRKDLAGLDRVVLGRLCPHC